jgi:hypothetical protein
MQTWLQSRGPGATGVNQVFPVLHMDIEVAEQRQLDGDRSVVVPMFAKLAGVDAQVSSISQPDPTPVDVADISVAT